MLLIYNLYACFMLKEENVMNKTVSRKIFIICFHTHSHASAVKMLNPATDGRCSSRRLVRKGQPKTLLLVRQYAVH